MLILATNGLITKDMWDGALFWSRNQFLLRHISGRLQYVWPLTELMQYLLELVWTNVVLVKFTNFLIYERLLFLTEPNHTFESYQVSVQDLTTNKNFKFMDLCGFWNQHLNFCACKQNEAKPTSAELFLYYAQWHLFNSPIK